MTILTNKINKNEKGYTLVELLLVVALVALSVGVTSDILLNIVRSYGKTQVMNEIEQNANFISLKIEKELRNADDADTFVGADTLPYLLISPRATPSAYVCYRLRNNIVERAINASSTCAGTYEALTSRATGNVIVQCINGCFTDVGVNPKRINIGLLFTQATGSGPSFTGDVEVVNTIVIRQTYD